MIATELNHAKCKSYLLTSESDGKAVMIDPVRERIDRYLAVLAYHQRRLELIIDTHTHADHRTGAFELGELTGAPVAMHRQAPAPHVAVHLQDGQWLAIGDIRLQVLHTPGHTPDSISLYTGERVFTGDVLLIHGTGRADFAGGDPGAQYDAIMRKLFALPDTTIVFPAHDYRGHTHSTIGEEKRGNPRIANRSRDEYIEIMNQLGLPLPDSIQESLQPNQSALDADSMKFPNYAQLSQVRQLSATEVFARLAAPEPPLLLDVREPEEYRGELGHISGSRLIPLRELSERTGEIADYKNRDIIVICRAGARSTTAAALLTAMGFERVGNLKGGMLDWNDAQLPVDR
jgi:sulfur dioxygenase